VRKHPVSTNAQICSFCHKSSDVVGKLISSPSDYPRVYICNECVAVCSSILEDGKAGVDERRIPPHPMENPNQCEHMWQGDFLWVTVSLENPAKQKPNEPVEYVPLERCIHCGLLRLTDVPHSPPDLAS